MIPRQNLDATPSRSRTRRGATALLAALVTLGTAASAQALPSDWLEYTAIAGNRLDIGSNIEVAGNYAVIRPGGRLTLGTNLFHSSVPADSFLAADEMDFVTGASANNVFVNDLQLNGNAEVRGTKTTPLALPININIPPLPPGVTDGCTGGASNVTVPASGNRTLAAGCYRNVLVNQNGTLELTGGTYIFRQLTIEADGQAVANGASTISVQDRLATGLRSFLSPQSGDPADLQIFAGGQQNQIGNEALFIGRIVAPNDPGLQFGVRATFIGNAYADGLNIFGVHLVRTPTPTPSATPTPTPTSPPTVTPFMPPTPTPTPTPPGSTPTPTPPVHTPTPTPTSPPTPTEPFNPPDKCPSFISPNDCP